MSNAKVVMGQAANTLVKPLEVEDVFSTYLYPSSSDVDNSIVNGIDLDGEGGMLWIKSRSTASTNHYLYDTVRGSSVGSDKSLKSNSTAAESSGANLDYVQFNSNGFTAKHVTGGGALGTNTYYGDMTSWTFRKAPKFFDVVTYTGDGVNGRAISHNLGCDVGSIFIKATSTGLSSNFWAVYHKETPTTFGILNLTNAFASPNEGYTMANIFGDNTVVTLPTSTEFTVAGNQPVNNSGTQYVAYLFAHNNGDGAFGPTGDQDIIKCGSYTGNGSTDGVTVDLGFEPQWLLFKDTTNSNDWIIVDNMRGMVVDNDLANADAYLRPNLSNQEGASTIVEPTSTGFKVQNNGWTDTSGANIIYIAIRRGTKVPESATEVFEVTTQGAVDNNDPGFKTDWPVDFAIRKDTDGSNGATGSRLTGIGKMYTDAANSENTTDPDMVWDFNNGWWGNSTTDSTKIAWMWKRAPGYFDVVAYSGTGTERGVPHNLGVTPEMAWIKARDFAGKEWFVHHTGLTSWAKVLQLQSTGTESNGDTGGNLPTATTFPVNASSNVNGSGYNYIAYLFATLPGVSKVGSYTGNGTSQTIDCGFTSGARFILIKRTDTSGFNWYVFDTARGIVSGLDPALTINTTDAEVTIWDMVDPDSSGFSVTSDGKVNGSGGTYIFYAIA